MRSAIAVLWFTTLLLVACASPAAAPAPPEIVYGQDTCDACGMIISEARFAAAAALEGGAALKFDDIGDMLRYQADHPDLAVAAWFVHDYPSESWLNAGEATFVVSPNLATPMGHGLAAFADSDEAKTFAEAFGGEILSWDDIRRRYAGS